MTKVRTLNPLVIYVIKRDILLIYVGVRRSTSRKNPRTRVTIINAIGRDTRHKTTRLGLSGHQNLVVIATTTKSMDIEILSTDQSLCGHPISLQGETIMHTTTTVITILGRAIITIKSMGMLLKIA